jgi:hypothetical protein
MAVVAPDPRFESLLDGIDPAPRGFERCLISGSAFRLEQHRIGAATLVRNGGGAEQKLLPEGIGRRQPPRLGIFQHLAADLKPNRGNKGQAEKDRKG